MSENWTTEASEWPKDLPEIPATLSSQHHTTELQNITSSHMVPGKQRSIFPPWLILVITAAVAGVVLLAFMVLLIWYKHALTHAKGVYSVARENHMRLHDKL
jgi:hypothetical protein